MMRRTWVLGIVAAAVGLWFASATGRADDTIKLDLKPNDAVKTTNLLGDGGADTLDVSRGGWGGGRWGWGGARWGWGGRWGWSGARWAWGGSPWGWSGARWAWGGPGWGWGWNRPWVNVGVGFGGPVISRPVYFVDPWYPVSLAESAGQPALSGRNSGYGPLSPGVEEHIPAPRAAPKDRTYQYDGGPANPVPMPQTEPAPTRTAPVIPEGRVVSISTKSPKYSYSAYGEKTQSRRVEKQQLAAKPK